MAPTREPVSPTTGEPLYFDGNHNDWFERHHALKSGSVAHAYRQHLGSSAPFILQELLPTSLLKRSNAKREKHPNAGKFGTAGVSGVKRRGAVRKNHPATYGTAGVSGVQRRKAVREHHANAGYFGTAGISGLSRSGAQEEKFGRTNELVMQGEMGSYLDSAGARRSSRVANSLSETSPTFDQFEDPPL